MDKFIVDGEEVYGLQCKSVEKGVLLCYANSGEAITRLYEGEHPLIWPVDSELSAYYEHSAGIRVTREDAIKLNIEIEDMK